MGFVAVGTSWGLKLQTGGFLATGSYLSTGFTYIPFISETLAKSYDLLEIYDSESRYRKVNGNPLGRQSVAGDVNIYIEPDFIGFPLYYLMGSVATATGSPIAGVNTHTFDVANSLPYFTSEWKYGTITDGRGKRAYNCQMKGATFDFADHMLTATFNLYGTDYSGGIVVSGNSIVNPTGRKFTFKDVHSGTTLGLTITVGAVNNAGGTTYTAVKVKTGQLQLDNGLITDDYFQGSQTPMDLIAGKFGVHGSFDIILDTTATDSGLVNWLEGTSGATVIAQYEGDIITGSTKYMIKFTIPNAWVKQHSVPMTNNEVIVRRVEWEGFYDPNSSSPKTVQLVLQNAYGTGANTYNV